MKYNLTLTLILIFLVNSYIFSKTEDDLNKIATATNIDTLKKFIDSDKEQIRIAVVERLGDIASDNAINLLKYAYEKEKYVTGKEVTPGVKEAVLIALGKTKSKNAQIIIIELLNSHLNSGPQLQIYGDSKFYKSYYHIYERRYFSIFETGIKSLSENFPDNQTLIFLNELFLKNLHWSIIQLAYTEIIWLSIKFDGINNIEKQTEYVLNKKTGDGVLSGEIWIKGGKGQKTRGAIIDDALNDIIRLKIGFESLPYVTNFLRKLPENDFRKKVAVIKLLTLQLQDIYHNKKGLNITDAQLNALDTSLDFWEDFSRAELKQIPKSYRKPLKEVLYFNKDPKTAKRIEKILK